MDVNYVTGFVFSDGQHVGQNIHDRIQTFGKRHRHTIKGISLLTDKALRQVDWSRIRAGSGKTEAREGGEAFSLQFNRRLSHWPRKAL